jgi:hypothetical protein
MSDNKKTVTKPYKGLYTSASPLEQPRGTYRFALNAVDETELGDLSFNSNEESNEPCYNLPAGYIPLGSVYIGNNNTVIFSVSSDELSSEIGITDGNCKYETHVNGDLGFKITHQIKATYRLRKGCERTIYFVDGNNNKPRYYNFDKPEAFKTGLNWNPTKFELVRSYSSIPTFDDIDVLDSGGQLEPGSYNVAIQYLDEDFNPTEWITTSHVAKVYNDDTSESYLEIRGSTNSDTDYLDFPKTDKSIRVIIGNLDTSFLFYRLAFIEATSGTGIVTRVNYTDKIPTSKNDFVYTGVNFQEAGTEAEIKAFNNIIDSAESIEQIENRLILGNTTGKKINFCNLQKFASRIRADMYVKKIFVNTMTDGNPKSPTVTREAAGYMPGEIYSFGIVYVFNDGTISPTYHIPGKNPSTGTNVIFAPENDSDGFPVTYPMSDNNLSQTNLYTDNSTCGTEDYWGVDYEGDSLLNQSVRHHRFPLRSALGLGLFKEEVSNSQENTYYQLKLSGIGTIVLPCTEQQQIDGECPTVVVAPPFQVRVFYTVDGVDQFLTVNIDPSRQSNPYELSALSNYSVSNNIVITKIEESQDDGTPVIVTEGVTSPKGIVYSTKIIDAKFTSETKIYSTQVFGIKFSGVDIPTPAESNGEEIVGYYIVRNNRDESEKTILDSGVLNQSLINAKYTSHGLLFPELGTQDAVSKRVFGLIHPEHKFNGYEYSNVTSIQQEGVFEVIDRKKSKARYTDVQEGSSFDKEVHKGGGGNDEDGWSLKVITRDNILKYKKDITLNLTSNDIEDIFYLDALQSRDIKDDTISAYNVSGDNKVGMLQLKDDYIPSIQNKMPYVYLKKDIANSYATFRTLPYYKASNNITSSPQTTVFGGDTYITPMKYVNTIFWDNRIAQRAGRTSAWNYVIGGILIVVGAVFSFFTVGATTLIVSAGIAIIGGGALFISSGIKRDALVRAYNNEYNKGLRETLLDNWVSYEYQTIPCEGYGRDSCDTPEDDEIQWLADCATDLWFESQVNISVRNGFATEAPTFMDAPSKIESGNTQMEQAYEHFGIYKQRDTPIYPFTVLDKHIMGKLSVFNPERESNRSYIGHPLGEFYSINPDYTRINSQKTYFHLGLEYDCCSECQEEFPHRVHYSEQSFQEELSDNYRIFLPNNYRDIEGEKGQITNLYRLQNNLYIHTEEALWHLPQNYQERVTNDIVSFIGTGSYFETPPRLIVDDSISSGGTQHSWGAIKTKNGILFPSQIDKKVYLFNGTELKAISDYGNGNWFKENMDSIVAQQYYNSNGKPYPFLNNPSNPYGEGFVSTYDTKKERLIITKKDFSINPILIGQSDYELCVNDGVTTVFYNYEQTIQDYNTNGWAFIGIEDCRMKFQKTIYEEVEEVRTNLQSFPNSADIWVMLDMSGSFDNNDRQSIINTINAWQVEFSAENPDWTGSVYIYQNPSAVNSEAWIKCLEVITVQPQYVGVPLSELDIIVISFVNESVDPNFERTYHAQTMVNPIDGPYPQFVKDRATFITLYNQLKSFFGITYPIVKSGIGGAGWTGDNAGLTRGFLQHSLAALKGTSYSVADIADIPVNAGLSTLQWYFLVNSLQGPNPYNDDGLENYGWVGQWNRTGDGDGNVINTEQFQEDINDLLTGSTSYEEITVTIRVPVIVHDYVDGEVLEGDLNDMDNSWTMSYSLKNNSWVSWHSYIPNFYHYISDKFFSWIPFNNSVHKHNRLGHYQEFYGVKYPFMVEYVSLPEPLQTKIWDNIVLHTEAKRYFPGMKQYVDDRTVTFNKAIIYNTRQTTGEIELINKDTKADPQDYLSQQVINSNNGAVIIDRNERNWSFNDIRDIRIDYTQPIFNSSLSAVQGAYYIDKVLNTSTLDLNKDWTQLESFRDKYLVVRLIFDNFDDVKLIMNYSDEYEYPSIR